MKKLAELASKHRVALSAALIVAVVVPTAVFWDWLSDGESGSTTIRNLGLVIGGAIALAIAGWRSVVADRQSRAAQRQAETAEADLRNKQFQEGATMLGSAVLSVRLAGIYALRSLAEEHPAEYHQRVMRSLCAFVRHPTADQSIDRSGGVCEDVELAVREIAVCHDAQIDTEAACGLDLRGAELRSASFHSVNLSSARIPTSMWDAVVPRVRQLDPEARSSGRVKEAVAAVVQQVPPLELAERAWVNLTLADLADTSLRHAKLRRTMLFGSDLSGADFTGADLSGAWFESASPAPDGIGLTKGLTQEQLDSAIADPEDPPRLRGTLDADTGKQLVWRGRTLDGEPHPNPPDIPDA